MRKLTFFRELSLTLGLYRPIRWFFSHFINRKQLEFYKTDLAFFAKYIVEGDLCFDIGAHTGEKTEVLLKLGARVIVYEPQADCMRELKARCGKNPRLTTNDFAMGGKTGSATFYRRRFRGVSGLEKNWEGKIESSFEVPLSTLDAEMEKYGTPKFCKIDVEGYEIEVFKGLSKPISLISFEYHFRDNNIQNTFACIQTLSNLSELQLNITPGENLKFRFSEWQTQTEFMKFFLNEVPKMPDYCFGCIFVKMGHLPVKET